MAEQTLPQMFYAASVVSEELVIGSNQFPPNVAENEFVFDQWINFKANLFIHVNTHSPTVKGCIIDLCTNENVTVPYSGSMGYSYKGKSFDSDRKTVNAVNISSTPIKLSDHARIKASNPNAGSYLGIYSHKSEVFNIENPFINLLIDIQQGDKIYFIEIAEEAIGVDRATGQEVRISMYNYLKDGNKTDKVELNFSIQDRGIKDRDENLKKGVTIERYNMFNSIPRDGFHGQVIITPFWKYIFGKNEDKPENELKIHEALLHSLMECYQRTEKGLEFGKEEENDYKNGVFNLAHGLANKANRDFIDYLRRKNMLPSPLLSNGTYAGGISKFIKPE
jgi:hypothetical protein